MNIYMNELHDVGIRDKNNKHIMTWNFLIFLK
jgi:hypothetical protein